MTGVPNGAFDGSADRCTVRSPPAVVVVVVVVGALVVVVVVFGAVVVVALPDLVDDVVVVVAPFFTVVVVDDVADNVEDVEVVGAKLLVVVRADDLCFGAGALLHAARASINAMRQMARRMWDHYSILSSARNGSGPVAADFETAASLISSIH